MQFPIMVLGAYTVGSLSTIVQALLEAGGPSAAGSFRDIQVRRGFVQEIEISLAAKAGRDGHPLQFASR